MVPPHDSTTQAMLDILLVDDADVHVPISQKQEVQS
jgi:hypothetical protein